MLRALRYVVAIAALAALPGLASADVLVASAARTASGTAALPASVNSYRAATFLLNVTAAATEVGDTLDVYLQSTVDGSTWDDFAHFTQVLGDGGAKKFLATWARDVTPESEMKAPADGALAAGVLQGPNGVTWRAKWVVVDGNANASFTFSISAIAVLR